MRALCFTAAGQPLELQQREIPAPAAGEVLIRVEACGVCRTDLHVQDAELPDIRYPIVPGHQVVGRVVARGDGVRLEDRSRVGAAWLGWTCGRCEFCLSGRENLCSAARFHGYHRDGGYADYMLACADYCLPIGENLDAATTTPLLCAGLIGYRSLRMAGEAKRIGLYGFGSAAHIIAQVALQQGRQVFAFTRAGDTQAQAFARELGATWAGDSEQAAPEKLDAALIFAPVGSLVPKALTDLKPGGRVVCGGIHMSDIPSFPYADLWGERQIRSVANLTREDGEKFMQIAESMTIQAHVRRYPLERANEALGDLREGRISGTAVLETGFG